MQISGQSHGGLDPAERTDTSKDEETATVLRSLVSLSGEKHAVDLETDKDVPTWSDIHTPLNFSACRNCLCAMLRPSLTPQCGSNGFWFGPESSWQKSFRKRTTGSRR